LAIIGLAAPDGEGYAEGGAPIEAAVGLLHLRLIQFVLRQDDLLPVLDHVPAALVSGEGELCGGGVEG